MKRLIELLLAHVAHLLALVCLCLFLTISLHGCLKTPTVPYSLYGCCLKSLVRFRRSLGIPTWSQQAILALRAWCHGMSATVIPCPVGATAASQQRVPTWMLIACHCLVSHKILTGVHTKQYCINALVVLLGPAGFLEDGYQRFRDNQAG